MSNKNLLYYEIHGEGDPLLLISGLNADHFFWIPVANILKKYFKVIICDNRGVGESQFFETPCTINLMANDVLELLNHLDIKHTHVIGHSLGGCIAQQIAISNPEYIDKLVLCSSESKISPLREYYIRTSMELMKSNSPRELIVKNALSWLFTGDFLQDNTKLQNLITLSLAKPLEESRRSFFYQSDALFKNNTANKLGEIHSPTLIINGEDDILIPLKDALFLKQHIAYSILTIVPKMAHMLPLENPELFCKYIYNFLI
ncbi:MAG TPA: hypothetical protein DD381_13100 [Lentisphaeria bacterium]|nr:MAG: hypothetical protein A2X47_11575 [Lentisphaerae bacterium GWF2_38_69]HBM17260.1 hypothetical protein [Lentisphaeria bacterium]